MPVSFKSDILPMFRSGDLNCMARRDVHLGDYAYMSDATAEHANAMRVRDSLSGASEPRMPIGGPYWTPAMLERFNRWMADGYLP